MNLQAMIPRGSAGRICHLENVKSYMSYLQQYTKIIKMPTLKTYYTPTHREGAILQSPCLSVRPSVCPSVHSFVTDISASTGRNDFIFDMWLWHGDLYRVSPFQVYCTSTSCLPCDLEFFMFAIMKIFVTDISACTGRNDFIFDIWLCHGDLYRVSPFQAYRTSTSCLPCDLRIFHVFTAFSGNEC